MKKNRILIIFILIGILASSVLSFNRMSVEAKNKNIDITLDLKEIEKLSEQSNQDVRWWLKNFKKWGVNSVALNEESFEQMVDENKPIEIKIVGDIIKDIHWKDKYPKDLVSHLEEKDIDRYDLVATTNSESLYKFIEKGLKERYNPKKYKIIESGDEYIFVLDGTSKEALYEKGVVLIDSKGKPYIEQKELVGSKLMKLGLGYDVEKVKIIKDSGLDVIIRPFNYNPSWTSKKHVEASLNEYQKLNIEPKYMLFTGEEVLGYPNNIDIVKKFVKDNNAKIGLIESGVQRGHAKQKGIEDFTRELNYNAIRTFSVEPYIQERYKYYNYEGAEEIENTLYRAVTERNIRLIYFRPFKHDSTTYVTDYKEYEKTFNDFKNRIAEHGMTLGESSVMEPNVTNSILKMLIALGVLGGGILLAQYILNINDKLKTIKIALGIPFIIAMYLLMPSFSEKIFALLAAIVFPSLSMVYFCSRLKTDYLNESKKGTLKNSIISGIRDLIVMVLISSIGALFVASTLSSIEYLLEMGIFRGVKPAQLMPIVIYLILFLGYFGYKKDKDKNNNKVTISDLKELLMDNIKILYVILGVGVLAVGYVYLARTGHETNIQPTNIEMIGRNFLEFKLIARPRTKEFLMAFPAVIIACDMAFNKRKLGVFITGLMIVLGQTSIVNTFSHLRTPMYLSIIRTVYGLLFGVAVGIIYLIILKAIVKTLDTLRGEFFNE